MFQTEPIHALQSLASDGMTGFMLAVSSLGYSWALIPILVTIAFGFDFKRGFTLVQIAVWNGLVTDVLKEYFFLPRPEAVDSTLLQPGDDLPEVAPFERGGAAGFWNPLPEEVVSYYRATGDFSRGFPSGHCSITTALWGSMALMFRKPWLTALALALIALMPLSRMYLARHFLADVLGGIVLGGLVIVAAFLIIRRFGPGSGSTVTGAGANLLLLGLPVVAFVLPGADIKDVVRIVGINLGLWLLIRSGLPEEGGTPKERIARVLLAVATYFLTHSVLTALAGLTVGETDLAEALIEGLAVFALTWGSTTLCFRLGLYHRPGGGATS